MTYEVGQVLLLGADKASMRPYIVTAVLSHIEDEENVTTTTYTMSPKAMVQ